MEAAVEHHPTATRVLVLAAIFGSGYFDAVVLKSKDLACATWFMGLAALAIWIAYPLTTSRILLGAAVLVSGLVLMIIYYRKQVPRSGV